MSEQPIRRLLVANRGEIASRIFRTAHSMGISTAAVYSDPDAGAVHVADADVSVPLRGTRAEDTYLVVSKLLDAAGRAGADALHPGYGFLSENAGLAEACTEAGVRFIGPSAAVIRAMGDKIQAKKIAASLGVPTLESIDVPDGTVPSADALGFPVLVKAAGGGGGRGMRVVEGPADLGRAIDAARREAAASFGNGDVFLERYLPSPRHVEIQLAADRHGNAVHLFERDCSVQRRYQKVIEEAPSPAVRPEVRRRMADAALALTRAIGYEGVGTVEFLLDGDDFFFLEMNTRIQVEHPVTEAVTGRDLVRWQLEIAAGAALPSQDDILLEGHAVEARLYAEDPAAGFLPSPGAVTHFAWTELEGVRHDDGVRSGSVVSVHYDPLLSKVIAHGRGRDEAIARLTRALSTLQVDGVVTNRDFLLSVLSDDVFAGGQATVDFLERRGEQLRSGADTAKQDFHVLAAVLHRSLRSHERAPVLSFTPVRWRNVPTDPLPTSVEVGGRVVEVVAVVRGDGTFEATVDGVAGAGRVWELGAGFIDIEHGGLRRSCEVRTAGRTHHVSSRDGNTRLEVRPRHPVGGPHTLGSGPTAEIPGVVISVEVHDGDAVEPGQTLLVMEAMKMEHRIRAGAAARILEVLVRPGDSVDAQQLLVRLQDLT